MRILLITFAFCLAAISAPQLLAQRVDPSDQFLKAYMAARQAEELERDGKLEAGLQRYRSAGEILDDLRKTAPDWQPIVVDYRANRISESILRLQERLRLEDPAAFERTQEQAPQPDDSLEGPLPSEPGFIEPSVAVPTTPAYRLPGGSGSDLLDEVRSKISSLEQELAASRLQIRQLQSDRLQMTRQLEAANVRLRDQGQELDRVKMSETELRAQLSQTETALQEALAAGENVIVLQEQVRQIEQELLATRAEREAADEESEAMADRLATAQTEITVIAAARQTAEEQRDQAIEQRDEVRQELDKARVAQADLDRLMAENAELTQKLASTEERIRELGERPTPESLAAIREQLQVLQIEMAAVQEENESYQATILALRTQLKNERLATRERTEEDERLAEENRLLREIVARELRDQARRDQAKKLVLEELGRLEVQSATLLENLDLLSQPVYRLSEAELAMLREGEPDLADTAPPDVTLAIALPKDPQDDRQPDLEPPLPESGEPAPAAPMVELDAAPPVPTDLEPLAREARELFNRKDYREAEKLYERILAQAPDNIYALSNLGVTRFRSGKLKAAEVTFEKAIQIDPTDSFTHGTLGIVYYRQGRYDDAVNVLTKAISLNPKNAIARNYLGITASQKGWQEAAEQELQAAVALNPNYADAHFNLAVLYATSDPPAKELARRHYRLSLDLGAEPDATMDRLVQ